MTAKERIRMIVLEAQALEETIEHYNPKCYIRTPYCKESIKRGVKQVRAHGSMKMESGLYMERAYIVVQSCAV